MDPWSVPAFKNLELILVIFVAVIKSQHCMYKDTQPDWMTVESRKSFPTD